MMVISNKFKFSIIELPNCNFLAIQLLKGATSAFNIYWENIKNIVYYLVSKAGFTYHDVMFNMEWWFAWILWEQFEKDTKEENERQRKAAEEREAMYNNQQQQMQQNYQMPTYNAPTYNMPSYNMK